MTHHHSHKLNTVTSLPSCHEEEELDDLDYETPAWVFDAEFVGQEVPNGFNAVKICLEGTMEADLLWKEAHAAAEKYFEQGVKIFWEIDLGLFDRMKLPLEDQTQFLTLCLSLEHFRDTLWKRFQTQTVGICLYRGNANFYETYKWDETQVINLQEWLKDAFGSIEVFANETNIAAAAFDCLTVDLLRKTSQGKELLALFCRDAAAEYLDLLARKLPDSLRRIVMLDGAAIKDPLLLAQLTINERYPNLYVAVNNKSKDSWVFTWEKSSTETAIVGKSIPQHVSPQASIGICFPSISCRKPLDYQGLKDLMIQLENREQPYRIISENLLTTEWDGLDYLFVAPQSLSQQGFRKLRGFCAAGGTVVSIGKELGVAQEISIEEFNTRH